MQINHGISVLPSALLLLIATACDLAVEPDEDEPENGELNYVVIYQNSFESPADTAGWHGYGQINFQADVPPEGGSQSLYVSGACTVPHFSLDLPPGDEDRYLKLRCWGKNLAVGGSAVLVWNNDGTGFLINDSMWTVYETKDSLFCPANQFVSLQFISGGIVASSMLIDLVEVLELE